MMQRERPSTCSTSRCINSDAVKQWQNSSQRLALALVDPALEGGRLDQRVDQQAEVRPARERRRTRAAVKRWTKQC